MPIKKIAPLRTLGAVDALPVVYEQFAELKAMELIEVIHGYSPNRTSPFKKLSWEELSVLFLSLPPRLPRRSLLDVQSYGISIVISPGCVILITPA